MKTKDPYLLTWEDSGTEDSDILWQDFTTELTELLANRIYWTDHAKNMGWRNRSGEKTFKAETALDFVRAIIPNTNDFSLYFTKHYNGFKIRISHHDAPMGENHILKPISEKQYEKERDY